MSQGIGDAGTLVLYDKDGNAVTVRVENGDYAVSISDALTHRKLDKIIVLLTALVTAMTGKH